MLATVPTAHRSNRIVMHQGNALMVIADTYPTLLKSLLECVQNAIDSNAKNVWITVNQKASFVSVRDDGDGASIDDFKQALESVCQSKKAKGKLGRFGRGLISPLGKCSLFTFTSAARDTNEYNEWSFVSKEIENSSDEPAIPRRSRPDLTRDTNVVARSGKNVISWNSEIAFHKIVEDRRISAVSMTDLIESILDKFGRAMLRKGVVVNVKLTDAEGKESEKKVTASTFTGTPIEEFKVGKKGEEANFRLFIARRTDGSRKGKVLVGESDPDQDFRISFAEFANSTDMISKEAISALLSGLFEGEIVSDTVKLHASRTHFQDGEGLLKFCLAINRWFKNVGEKILDQAQSEKKEERWQELGQASMRHLEDLIMNNPDFAHLREIIQSFQIGSVGTGHAKVPKKDIIGPDNEKSIVVKKRSTGEKGSTGESGGSPEKEHPLQVPFVVGGPRGTVRKLVKGNSSGLKFGYVDMLEQKTIWTLDMKTGLLAFNVRNEAWIRCEEAGDRQSRQYQEFIAINALTLATVPEDQQERIRLFVHDSASAFSTMLTMSDAFSGRMHPV